MQKIYVSHHVIKMLKLMTETASKLVYGDDVDSLVSLDWTYILEHESEWTDKYNKLIEGN